MEIETLRFRCPGLEDGGRFPRDNTGRGKDLSPEIVLENLSPQAKTLAHTLQHLSHPVNGFTHTVMWTAGPPRASPTASTATPDQNRPSGPGTATG